MTSPFVMFILPLMAIAILQLCRGASCSGTCTSTSTSKLGAVSQDDLITEDYRICRVPEDQVYGYVCADSEYNRFADKLEALLEDHAAKNVRHSFSEKSATWGKRRFPFPANSTILAVGNSLTRQVFQQLPCQYADQLESWTDVESNQTNAMRRGTFHHGRFANGAQVFLVTNHALFYSPQWPQYLRQLVGDRVMTTNEPGKEPSSSWHDMIDLVVVGHINHFQQAYNTSFVELMREQTKKWKGADFQSVNPPNMTNFVEIFQGHDERDDDNRNNNSNNNNNKIIPIVGLSMMADWSYFDQDYQEMTQQLEHSRTKSKASNQQSHVYLVHGRQYVPQLGECGSNDWQHRGNCSDAPDMHRCIGQRGGHPDLIAFDVVENIHSALTAARNEAQLGRKNHLRG